MVSDGTNLESNINCIYDNLDLLESGHVYELKKTPGTPKCATLAGRIRDDVDIIVKELEEKILKEGHALSENILKVDSFINHQVDPVLMQQIGDAFAGHFGNKGITKVVTIESSGIAPALMTAISLNVPMIILKKQPSKVLNDNLLQTVVTSFTKGTSYELTLSHQFIEENDNVLIIDDFLANGEAASGAIRLLTEAGASIAGVGILIEKSFQPGRDKLIAQGVDVYSLARVSRLAKGVIEFIPEEC